jgi:mannose-1-phosphate guanylyltransferase
VGLGAVYAIAGNPDSVVGVLPADHAIRDEAAFRDVVARALALAAGGAIVTVGVRPTHAETGYGWLEPGAPGAHGSVAVARFHEKPDRAAAERYLAAGYLWNGGMFFFRADRILAEIRRHLPLLADGLDDILAAHRAGGAGETIARIYPRLPAISLDYGVMEKTSGIVAVPGDFGWSDVGSWAALADLRAADGAGNVVEGRAVLVDAGDNLVSADPGALVALVGVSGLVVVRAGDAVLVVPRERAQDVREVVKRLEEMGLDAFV